jgi:hypothetical protein
MASSACPNRKSFAIPRPSQRTIWLTTRFLPWRNFSSPHTWILILAVQVPVKSTEFFR